MCWVLITHELDCYLFKEGYLRTSSSEFKIDQENIDDKFVHLTNNAVQKFSKNYGNFEDGNQMSFKAFQEYLNEHNKEKGIKLEEDIIPQMKNLVKKSILAVRKKINAENRKYSFEIMGYDFIIDTDFNVWLIEVNTNPCIEESYDLLKMILPRMISDAMKLTLDIMFPPLPQYSSPANKKYPVTGYADDFNMWYYIINRYIYRELMCGTTDHSIQIPTPPTVIRSEYVITINDDQNLKIGNPKTSKKNSQKSSKKKEPYIA